MVEDNEKDTDQKTEEPTQKRLEHAEKEGQVPVSRDVIHWVMLAACATVLLLVLPASARKIAKTLIPLISAPHEILLEPGVFSHLITSLLGDLSLILILPLSILVLAPLAAGIFQVGTSLSFSVLSPKFERISLSKGLKRVFSKRSLVEITKSILKITVLGSALFFTFKKQLYQLEAWIKLPLGELHTLLQDLIWEIFLIVLIILAFIAGFDYLFQRREFFKQLRMTKQELKDEFKETEGDQQVRQKLRQLRQERTKKRMMLSVPTATAIIIDPEHFAIAILWDQNTMTSPKVIAKGKGHIALKIREIAEANKVPVIENPPLAHSLFDHIELEQEIQSQHYKDVANVIHLVAKMKQK
jgi:flagellar biosynthetic protein FlhB